MVLEAILTIVLSILKIIFTPLPSLPSLPSSFQNAIDTFFNFIFNGANLLDLFVRIDTLKVIGGLVIGALLFEQVYIFAMFILKKIPMLNIK